MNQETQQSAMNQPLSVIPVLDILDRVVVRGVAGEREKYAPIQSVLTPSSQPLAVAEAIREHFQVHRLYVADLDAIMHQQANVDLIQELASRDFELLIDGGVRTEADLLQWLQRGAAQVVLGLETLPNPEFLERAADLADPERLVLSIDMRRGELLTGGDAWTGWDPVTLADYAVSVGVGRIIVLDLASVGVSDGVSTFELCRQLVARFPRVEWITGGGVRDADDLRRLQQIGVSAALVASALHSGQITAQQLQQLDGER